nr:capsular biosynthesis protein [Gemmatimonadota bacterium]
LHTALDLGIPISTWKSSYLSARFYMQQVRDGHLDFYRLKDHSWNLRAATPLTEREEQELDASLHTRYHKPVAFDVPRLHREMGEKERFRERYGIDPEKPVWGIMCHINWDSVADYSPMAYSSFDEWTIETIEQASRTPDVQWLIKVHPVEASYDRQVGVEKLIETRFPDLPPHVKLVPSTEKISPFEFFEMLDGGVTVYGTPGLELALAGKPVILAGEAHYGRKGFTHDAFDADSYRSLLARAAAIGPLTPEQKTLARRYAYSVFIQRQIPLPVVRDPERLWWNLQHQKRERLLPGADPFLDFICERIIDGGDFIMDSNLVTLAESETW